MVDGSLSKNTICFECRGEYNRRYYQTVNREKHIAQVRVVTQRCRAWLAEQKAGQPCTDCGGLFDPVCMDFDHVRGKKLFNVSRGIADKSRESVLAEIRKCDLVCANCHRLRTKKRSGC